jgi:hypothetical protein
VLRYSNVGTPLLRALAGSEADEGLSLLFYRLWREPCNLLARSTLG